MIFLLFVGDLSCPALASTGFLFELQSTGATVRRTTLGLYINGKLGRLSGLNFILEFGTQILPVAILEFNNNWKSQITQILFLEISIFVIYHWSSASESGAPKCKRKWRT
ncbi:MAG: hypothetical protein LBT09_05300 [Planctomycetaceae bacterium]|jgi:hypothetical protein|nr:hypothetical protein [Planctomycetaceae bacterium]